jgi:hypothetical protein
MQWSSATRLETSTKESRLCREPLGAKPARVRLNGKANLTLKLSHFFRSRLMRCVGDDFDWATRLTEL